MKRTFLAMLVAGSSMAAFAQTTPTTPTTPTNPTTSPTSPTTQPTTTQPTTNQPTTTQPTTTQPTTTQPSTDPMNTTTSSQVDVSTSWEPGTSPYWGWNSHGIWDPSMNANMNTNANMNNNNMNANATLNSTSSYNAYSGTAVAALPANIQNKFSQDFASTANNSYTWSQYGDWFHTYYMGNGRLTQYFYDTRGNGYSLSLPVIQSYVPEDIIDKALQKYGARLYSISMVQAADSGNTYQLGLIERGQLRMEYLNDQGATVPNVWRTEEMDSASTLNATDANAAMGTEGAATTTETPTTETPAQPKETEMKVKEDGTKTKVKVEDDKTKVKQKKVDD